jgi:heptosyltransferase-1
MPMAARILIVRLGALGDILHTLPAVAALKRAHPCCRLVWAVQPRFAELLAGGGLVSEIVRVDRRSFAGLRSAARALRAEPFDFAIDFQGLLQSALVARVARAGRIFGFSETRERAAAMFYSDRVTPRAAHVVDMNMELATLAGARDSRIEFPLPPGREEGELPAEPFVLAAPLAGWVSKQWPLTRYGELAGRLWDELGVRLVLNGAPWQQAELRQVTGALAHSSSISGLIAATRRAAAVLGVDSGPMHLGAALRRPGVALFGPTDPARNGPYSESFRVLRAPDATTTYKRETMIHASMQEISVDAVFEALRGVL